MSYGIRLINNQGAIALDQDAAVLHTLASGSTIPFSSAYATAANAAAAAAANDARNVWRWVNQRRGVIRSDDRVSNGPLCHPHIVAGGLSHTLVGSRAVIHPTGMPATDAETLFFYQLGTRKMFSSVQYLWDFPDPSLPSGMMPIIQLDTVDPLAYRAARTVPVVPAGAGTYGLRINDAAGRVVFDSRAPFTPIRFAFILTQAQMDMLLTVGQPKTLDVTLPEAMPDAWIGSPFYFPHCYLFSRIVSGNYRYLQHHISVRQLSSTVIRFEFEPGTFEVELGSAASGLQWIYTHDAIFYVGRNV